MEYKICDLMNVNRGASPRPIIEYLTDNGYRWLKISDFSLGDRYVYKTKEYIKEEGITKTKFLKKGTLILTNSATPGIPIFLGEDMCLHDGFLYFQNIKEEIISKEYLYYCFIFNRNNIVNQANGSVFKNLKKEIIMNLSISLPSLNTQKKVVKILNNIDNKIELNNQTNDNLLELINNLYKESFSNIEEYKQADEIANITIGKTPPRSNRECFTYNEDDIKWLSISDLGKCGIYAWNTSEKLTEKAVNKYNVKVIPENTIVLSFKLTIGRIAITANKMATNEAIAHFNLLDNDMIYYLYSYLKNFDYSKLGNTSSIATAVNSKIIKAMPIGIPNKNSVLEFNNTVRPLFEKIKLNEEQNMTLRQLRDTLLPKLMNGEIDLDKIEI